MKPLRPSIDIYSQDGKILPNMNLTAVFLSYEAKAKPQPASAPSVIGFVGTIWLI